MSANLFYLLTLLPPLPAIGEPLPCKLEGVLAKLRIEENSSLDALADCFSVEPILKELQRIFLKRDYDEGAAQALLDRLPKNIRKTVAEIPAGEGEFVVWQERSHFAWLEYMWQAGAGMRSRLLQRWSSWEAALAIRLAEVRTKGEFAFNDSYSIVSEAPDFDYDALASEWKKTADPMVGERRLDEARIDFLYSETHRYSFDLDELVSYLLHLRLLSRYAALDRTVALGILEEVTAL